MQARLTRNTKLTSINAKCQTLDIIEVTSRLHMLKRLKIEEEIDSGRT